MRIEKNRVRNICFGMVSVCLMIVGVLCTAVRVANAEILVDFDSFAAETTMPAGAIYNPEETEFNNENSNENSKISEKSEKNKQSSSAENKTEVSKTETKSQNKTEKNLSDNISDFQTSIATAEEIEEYEKQHEGEEQYPVLEFTTTIGNQSYGDIHIKNASSFDMNIKEELEGELGFSLEDTKEPQVLIYHTHTCESFLTYDTGYFYEGFYPRTTDSTKNICAVGDEITKQLNDAGIVTLHDKTLHDSPSYNGAYDRSYETVSGYLEKYPSIKVVLDIHRDGIGNDVQRSKPVFMADGKKAAQIMILAGYNYDDDPSFTDWEYNLRFALQIQKNAQEMYPDMVRPLYFADFMYNMNINTGSLLIEIGADGNTLEEVRYSGYLLGKVLAKVLKNNAMQQAE